MASSSITIKSLLELYRVHASDDQISKLNEYSNLLEQKAMPSGFIASCSYEMILMRHILDSLLPIANANLRLLLSSSVNSKPKTIVDMGTGAGLPGLPLAIALPNQKFILTDSSTKRLDFVSMVKKNLDIKNIQIIKSQADELKQYNLQANLVIFRAFRKILSSLELALNVVQANGTVIYWRAHELFFEKEFKHRLNDLGWEKKEFYPLAAPEALGSRGAQLFMQACNPKEGYPRAYRKIKKDKISNGM